MSTLIEKKKYNEPCMLNAILHMSNRSDEQKRGGGGGINYGRLICNLVKERLFQALTAVSGSSFAGEGCIDTNASWKIH